MNNGTSGLTYADTSQARQIGEFESGTTLQLEAACFVNKPIECSTLILTMGHNRPKNKNKTPFYKAITERRRKK